MLHYPIVRDEFETLRRVLAGASLARYGDGEFNLCFGRPAKAQRIELGLSERLREILHDSGACMVGIPNIHSATPKGPFWAKHLRAAQWLAPRPYASSFITRPDSAPWIDTPDYWLDLESLWAGRDVTVVRGGRHGLAAEDLSRAHRVTVVECPERDAFSSYDRILQQIGHPDRTLLCLGPTATVLAVDLCARGVHAIDVGHVGMFWRKHRRGEPMTVTDEDKDRKPG